MCFVSLGRVDRFRVTGVGCPSCVPAFSGLGPPNLALQCLPGSPSCQDRETAPAVSFFVQLGA